MKIVLMILLLIASIVLIASILFQSGNSAGLSSESTIETDKTQDIVQK